jgi:hypothetical protein
MKPSRSAVSLALLGLCALLPARAAAPGERSWQYEGPPGTVFDVAVRGNRVFAAGLLDDLAFPGRTDWVVQASDAKTGAPVWIDRFDGVDGLSDGAFAVAAEGNVVVGAGFATRAGQGRNWFVRAYDARNGTVLWQDEIHGGRRDQAQAVVIAGGLAYVAGVIGVSGADDPCVAQGLGNCNFVVRAYDAKTGALRWQDSHDNGAGGYDEANGISVKGDTVFAVGDVAGAFFGLPDIHVRAYDARTGALRWADTFDAGLFDAAAQVAAFGDLVVVAGAGGPGCVLPDPTSDCDAIVRAYDARTGAVRWSVQHDEAGGFDEAFRIVATAGVVVAAGRVTGDDGLSHMAVFAFDRTGERLWAEVVTLAAGESSIARGLAAQGTSVIAVGGGGPGCVGEPISDCDILVRAYDAPSGALGWSDRFDEAGGDDVANAVALSGDTAYVGGSVGLGFGQPADLAVRAYRDQPR